MELTGERSLVSAALDCLRRRAGEPTSLNAHQRLRRAAEHLDEARGELAELARESAEPDPDGCSVVQLV